MRPRFLAAWFTLAALALAATTSSQTQRATPRPKLVVLLVVDQMRADYIPLFRADWTGGLKRLVTRGAWFTNARYPYLTTVTCAGHATVSTGTFPHVHGVMQNAWWDRDARRLTTCTADPRERDLGYGVPDQPGESGYRLEVPAFADRMRVERAAHVVALSLKDRSAIMLAGHGADAVAWMSNTLDGWVTSSAYGLRRVAEVQQFIQANPLRDDYEKTWTRLLDPSRYRGRDDGLGETPPMGWTRTFPHVLNGLGSTPDATFVLQWQQSPYADAYLGRFAAALVESMQLGKHDGTDVLSVGFSAPDLVGHSFGPRSQEVQDMYAHLDRTLGTLLDRLDALVGANQYVVALTADHGVTPIPEQLVAEHQDAGRISSKAVGDAIEEPLRKAFGGRGHVALAYGNDIYLAPGVYEKLKAAPALLESVVAAASAIPGVQKVFGAEQVNRGASSRDGLLRAAALGYFPGRSGDLVLVPKPGWMFSVAGTTHGTASADDQRVPILFLGRGVKPGQYSEAVTPADIAPTLAALCGITMPAAEGRALRSALKQ